MAGSPLVAAALAEAVGHPPTVVGAPEPALAAGWSEELEAARPTLAALQTEFEAAVSSGRIPVTALSRCAVALATLPVIARHHPDAVVVWFDAHADVNTPSSTTTGYLGGLALSGPLGLWDSGLGSGLMARNAILAGTRDIDPPEQQLIDRGEITLIEPGVGFAERLAAAVAGRPVYVHIDCDVLEPHTVPTDYQVPGGLTLADLRKAASVLAQQPVVGLELGEFESADSAEETRVAARAIVDAVRPLLDAAARGEKR
jgi:arginase